MEKSLDGTKENFWLNRKVIIVIHEATTGPGHDLRDYLLQRKVEELLFISHPLLYLPENFKNSSRYELYKRGEFVKSKNAFHWILPEPFLYVKDFLYTFFWSITLIKKGGFFFGLGNLNAFTGWFLKFFRTIDTVIYYPVDYVPKRFHSKVLNLIYHHIEKFCAQHSDWTWNFSPRVIEARSKRWGMTFKNQLIVPHGVHFNRIKRLPFEKIHKTEVLYMGTLFKKQGVQLVVEALPEVIKKFPEIKFVVIGKGPYELELKKLVKKLKVAKYVEFLGYIPSHAVMENRIAQAAVAVALYDKKYDDFSYYGTPGKIKNYLGAGVPIIMTDVPYGVKQVEDAQCGFIIKYSKDELADKLVNFFSNEKIMKSYRINALKFAKKYDWDRVFAKALTPVCSQIIKQSILVKQSD